MSLEILEGQLGRAQAELIGLMKYLENKDTLYGDSEYIDAVRLVSEMLGKLGQLLKDPEKMLGDMFPVIVRIAFAGRLSEEACEKRAMTQLLLEIEPEDFPGGAQ